MRTLEWELERVRITGRDAGLDGRSPSENPYAPGTKARRAWADGWHEAYGYAPEGGVLDTGPL